MKVTSQRNVSWGDVIYVTFSREMSLIWQEWSSYPSTWIISRPEPRTTLYFCKASINQQSHLLRGRDARKLTVTETRKPAARKEHQLHFPRHYTTSHFTFLFAQTLKKTILILVSINEKLLLYKNNALVSSYSNLKSMGPP